MKMSKMVILGYVATGDGVLTGPTIEGTGRTGFVASGNVTVDVKVFSVGSVMKVFKGFILQYVRKHK